MKKILLIIICSFCLQVGKAQTTTINDTAILNYLVGLQNHINAAFIQSGGGWQQNCFSGNTMFTSLFSQLTGHAQQDLYEYQNNALSIDLSNRNITNIEGLQYIKIYINGLNLSHNKITNSYVPISFQTQNSALNLSYNLLTTPIVTTPGFLTNDWYFIDASHNQIAGTVVIPFNATNVYYDYNQITSASIFMQPLSIPNIGLSHNLLTSMPIIKPYIWYSSNCSWCGYSYDYIDLSYNNITNIDSNILYSDTCCFSSSAPFNVIKNLNLSHNNLSNMGVNKLLQITRGGEFVIGNINLSNNNLNSSPDLFEGLMGYNCSGNNIYCLPKIPTSLTSIVIDSAKITCIPNVGTYNVNGHPSANYPVCNPTNNNYLCHAYPTIVGRVFNDNNHNNIKDGNDLYRANVRVGFSNTNYTFTDDSGYYKISAPDTGYATLTVATPNLYTAVPASVNYYFPYYDTVFTNNIALQPNIIKDSLSVKLNQVSCVRNGWETFYRVNYRNIGTTTTNPTALTFTFDTPKLGYDSSSKTAVQNGNTLTFNIGSLVPGQHGYIDVYFTVWASLLDIIFNNVKITGGTASDADSAYSFVRSSFDPNEKEATKTISTTDVSLGNFIDYTIHFQNTGNDTAFNIVVSDSLSSKLQANSLEILESSNKCKASVIGKTVYFEFLNIMLPDSNVNLLGSNGFVRFRVKPINSLIVGDSINNKANIYFDYNKPVLTNTATTKIVAPVIVPLKFTNYDLRFTNDRQVENKWTTANEVNVSHFNVQRSLNGKDFVTIHKEQAKNRSYNSYSYEDNSLPLMVYGSVFYYRLESVDRDGRKQYSEVRNIEYRIRNNELRIYPNPAKDAVTINSKGVKNVTVTDCFGRLVYKAAINRTSYTLDITSFAKGIYIFSFDNGEKVKVVKE